MDDNAPASSEEPVAEPPAADRQARSARRHRSIEDNYPEYLEHEYGYAYEVADVMSQEAIARHEELLYADADELERLDLSELDDFQKWAVARNWRRKGEQERFFDICSEMLTTSADDEHPVVIYSEISRWLAEEYIAAERLEDANRVLEGHLDRWPSDVQARELAGIVEVLDDGEADDDEEAHSGLDALADEYPADAELRFEIAEDLWRFGKADAAKRWLEEARQVAARTGDEAAMVDIELLDGRMNSAG